MAHDDTLKSESPSTPPAANTPESAAPAPKLVFKKSSLARLLAVLILLLVVIGIALVPETQSFAPKNEFWATVQAAAGNISALMTPIAATILGVGTATMAFFQALKDLFNLRTYYNRWAVQRWIRKRVDDEASATRAIESLQQLGTGGESDALYSLEIEKLADQIAIAGRMALDRPEDHATFLRCLVKDAPKGDQKLVVTPPNGASRDATYLEAKARGATYVQRAVDGFRNTADYHYTHLNQVAVFILNFTLFLVLWIYWSGVNEHLVSVIGAALLSAFIAPIAKDLITGLQSLKDINKR